MEFIFVKIWLLIGFIKFVYGQSNLCIKFDCFISENEDKTHSDFKTHMKNVFLTKTYNQLIISRKISLFYQTIHFLIILYVKLN